MKKTISIDEENIKWLKAHKEIQMSGLVNKLLQEYIQEVTK